MYVKKLKLKDYRNYEFLEVDFDKNINIIYGNNAEGKTNLLESIYMCATTKSHRNSKDKEIINLEKDEAHICIIYNDERKERNQKIDIQLNKDKKKGIAINGVKIDNVKEILSCLNVVLFAPEDLNIIKDGPVVRRKFIDIEICKTDKIYVDIINKYNKLLNERNILLKDIKKENNANKETLLLLLDTYDEKLVDMGTRIIIKRSINIKKLAENIIKTHYYISNEKEKLIVGYENDVLSKIEGNIDKEIIKNTYDRLLKETRDIDIKNEWTSIGVHRDDISFFIEEKDIRKFGSQGQKKTAAISLKLSELNIIKEKTNSIPILLLDDVFSELDETRQKLLIENMKDVQTIITCTGIKKNIFEILRPNKIFKIENGSIKEKVLYK